MEKHVGSVTDSLQDFIQKYMTHIVGQDMPVSNPGLLPSYRNTNQELDHSVSTYVVEAAVPSTGLYIVRKPNSNVQHICTQISHTGGFMSASDMSTIPIGSQVLVATLGGNGVILGEQPYQIVDKRSSYMDFISTGSGFNYYASPLHNIYYSKLKEGKRLPVLKPNSAYDSLGGDRTVSTPTGVMSHIDADMAFMRTSEICGVFFFRESGQTRLSGESLEVESFWHRRVSGVEHGESYDYAQTFFYPWEIVGAKQSLDSSPVEFNTDNIKDGTLNYGEPVDTDAIPISRFTELGGFLGQGQQFIVSAPQWSTSDVDIQTSDLPVKEQGLCRTFIGRDGTYMVESARQLLFVKAADVLVPRLKGLPTTDDPDYTPNDANDDYPPNANAFADRSVSGLLPNDHYANVAGWQSLVGAVARPDVAVVSSEPSTTQASFDLGGGDTVTPPEGIEVEIDDNYKKVTIEQVLNMFAMLPNGDVLLRNGLGAELKMSGGSISLSGVGVHVNAGKTMSIVGNRVSVRANKDAEISSANDALRFKAQTDVMFLAANGGSGGFIVDHRGTNADVELNDKPELSRYSGITLKSQLGHVSLVGGSIVAKTGPVSAGSREGKIVLDSGRNEILMKARIHRRYATSSYHDHFGDINDIRRTNSYFSSGTVLTGSLTTLSTIVSGGSIQATKGMFTVNGPFATGEERYTERVFLNPRPDLITDHISNTYDSMSSNGDLGVGSLQTYVSAFEQTGRPLNPVSIRRTAFGFPSSAGYAADGQNITQPYWQQLPIVGKRRWTEPSVRYPIGNDDSSSSQTDTLPWPGKDRWSANSMRFAKNPSNLFNVSTQRVLNPKDYTDTYKDIASSDYQIDYVRPDENFYTID